MAGAFPTASALIFYPPEPAFLAARGLDLRLELHTYIHNIHPYCHLSGGTTPYGTTRSTFNGTHPGENEILVVLS